MKTTTAALLVLAAGVCADAVYAADAGSSSSNSSRGRDCLFARHSHSWRVLDRQHLILWGASQKDAYLVTLFTPLHDLSFAESLAFIDGDHNGMICGDSFDKIAVPDSKVTSFPSDISSMRKVDQAELLALGEQYKVKLVSEPKAQELKRHDKKAHGE